MVRRLLASFGIGSAKVDTLLTSHLLRPGERLEGIVHLRGGQADQRVLGIYLDLLTNVEHDDRLSAYTVARFELGEEVRLGAGQEAEVLFNFMLPLHTPSTLSPDTADPKRPARNRVWLRTGLAVSWGLDPQDSDPLEVLPLPAVEVVLEGVRRAGFRLVGVRNATQLMLRGAWLSLPLPVVQTFSFVPTAGSGYAGRLDRLELTLANITEELEFLLQLDRSTSGLGGLISDIRDTDESTERLRFPADLADPERVHRRLGEVLEQAGV
jgi:sporulation-control protein